MSSVLLKFENEEQSDPGAGFSPHVARRLLFGFGEKTQKSNGCTRCRVPIHDDLKHNGAE
jgi:hypothetical protein